MDDFLWRALFAGFAVAAVTGPLGSFVVWRRMAFFGDTLAHSALLGAALGMALGVGAGLGVIAVGLGVAVMMMVLKRGGRLAGDTLLAIMSSGGLALGIVALAVMESPGVNLMSFLIGDILAVSLGDIAWIYGGGAFVVAALIWLWRPLLSATINEDLARVEGVAVDLISLAFMVMLALTVALAMKVVGILLITALLIIPSAAARNIAGSPELMAFLASLIGCGAVGAGLFGAVAFDAPVGPMIVIAALSLFAFSAFAPALRRR
ncbi:MAG: metal ABC transporter permease [Rhodospirillales bacterium]